MSVVKREKLLRHVVMVAKFLDDNKRKRHLKREFALFETLSILFNFISLVKCWRNVQKSVMHVQSCCFANIRGLFTWKWRPQVGEVTRLGGVKKSPSFTSNLTTPPSQGALTQLLNGR